MYQKQRDEVDDAETEAFAKGELEKFNQERSLNDMVGVPGSFCQEVPPFKEV